MSYLKRTKSSLLLTSTLGCLVAGGAFMVVSSPSYASGIAAQESSAHSVNVAQEDLAMASLTSAAAISPSEKLISDIGEQAISFLADENLSDSAREEAFRELLINNFDMKTIGRFVLGRYWRTATPEQKDEYFDLFEDMVIKTYSKRFSEYSGQKLVVTGSRDENGADKLVTSLVKGGGSDISVDWRVREKSDGSHKIVDVIVEGVSMSVTQRSDFSSVIQRGGGNIEALLQQLRGG
jgi:phospholipid transport system substrate-binding protein